jgi:DNA-binding GntR family transcriptional regulator
MSDKPKIQRVPPYAQIANTLRQKIKDGELRPGDRLPSVRNLATEYGVSPVTADKALSALRSEGLLIGSPSGSTVAENVTAAQTGGDRFRRMISTGRATRPGERSEIQSSELVSAPDEVADALTLQHGANVIRRVRHFLDDDGLAAISTSWLASDLAETVPALLNTAPLEGGTIGAIQRAAGRQATMGVDTARARLVTEQEAEAFGVETPAAVLVIESRVADNDGNPIEYGVDVIAPGRPWPVSYDLGES